MTQLIKDLWAGERPLRHVFWRYAVGYGLLVNLVTTLALLAVLLNDTSLVLAVLAFALPIPYNVFVAVAVWRSADRYQGSKTWADLARVATVIWMVVLSAI